MQALNKIAVAIAAIAASGLTAASAHADEMTDLKARVAELEKQVKVMDGSIGAVTRNFNLVTQGEEAGYFKLPGSQTGYALYGFAHLDVYKDLKGRQCGDWAASIGDQPSSSDAAFCSDTRKGKFNMTARQSRFGGWPRYLSIR